MGLTLWTTQVADLAYYMANDRCMNLSDPATGKTPPTCVYAWYLWSEKGEKTVWIMPGSIMEKNRDELLRWTEFKPEDVVILPDLLPQQRAAAIQGNAKVFITGGNLYGKIWRDLLKHQPSIKFNCIDESHLIYLRMSSNRTQQWLESLKYIPKMLPMTGTLVDGALDTAYPMIHAIEPRYYGSHSAFMAYHAVTDDNGQVLWWKNHEKLQRILYRHAIRHTFEEVHGPEAKVLQVEKCEMSPRQRAAYDEFHEKAMLELEDGFLDGTLPPVAVMRARQIMAHPHDISSPTGARVSVVGDEETGKDALLQIHLENHKRTGKPLLIFSSLVPEQERIAARCEKMGFRVGLINGNVSTKRRAEIDRQFRAGLIDIVVGSPATMSVGFNWDHCGHVIFVSIDYKDTSFIQAYRRCIRGARKYALLITVFEYRKSIDQRIFQIVEEKSLEANKVDPTRQVIRLLAA